MSTASETALASFELLHEDSLDNLRDPSLFAARDSNNTDIIATTIPTRLATNGEHAVRFLTGIESEESMNAMLADQNRIELEMLQHFELEEWYGRARHTYTESGLLDNSGNRYVER